jgi:hypothetical protein
LVLYFYGIDGRMVSEYGADGGLRADKGSEGTLEVCPYAMLPTTHPTWPDQGWNLGHFCGQRTSKCLVLAWLRRCWCPAAWLHGAITQNTTLSVLTIVKVWNLICALRVSNWLKTCFLLVNHSIACKIWGFHGGDYEECCLLGCCAMWLL